MGASPQGLRMENILPIRRRGSRQAVKGGSKGGCPPNPKPNLGQPLDALDGMPPEVIKAASARNEQAADWHRVGG